MNFLEEKAKKLLTEMERQIIDLCNNYPEIEDYFDNLLTEIEEKMKEFER